MDDKYFMNEALILAKECAEDGEVPVGAVVVRNGEIVGRGKNHREERLPSGTEENTFPRCAGRDAGVQGGGRNVPW